MQQPTTAARRRLTKMNDRTWHETTQHERNRKIFDEELADFLPSRILDFHVHVFNEGTVPEGEQYCCAGHPITSYDYAALDCDLRECYPGRETCAVCFGTPHAEYDRAHNDAYVAANADHRRFFPLRLFDPNEKDRDAVRQDLLANNFLGIKPYLNYVRKEDPNDVEVHEMLPAWIMEIVNDLGLIVMLHIPRKQRLADPLNQRQVVELCERYPNAKVVLAHIGRAYFLKGVVGFLDRFRELPNLWYDTAMVNHWEVLAHAFATVNADKMLYGTDLPIAVAPGKSVEINHQYTYVTPVPWKLSISDDHGKLQFTSFLYEQLRGIKQAIEFLGRSERFVEDFFFNNGMKLLVRVRADLGA